MAKKKVAKKAAAKKVKKRAPKKVGASRTKKRNAEALSLRRRNPDHPEFDMAGRYLG